MDYMERATLIKEALTEAEAALDEIEEQASDLEAQSQRLKAEIRGLRLALAAHEQPQKDPFISQASKALGSAPTFVDEWKLFKRTDAIERIFLEGGGKPLHRKDLTHLLHSKGRDDPIEDVSAALAYLKRIGRAQGLGNGRWVVPVPEVESEAPQLDAEATDDKGGDL